MNCCRRQSSVTSRATALAASTQDYATEALTACGVLIADVTEAISDSDGSLRREFWVEREDDFVHANERGARRLPRKAFACLAGSSKRRYEAVHSHQCTLKRPQLNRQANVNGSLSRFFHEAGFFNSPSVRGFQAAYH